MFVKIMIIITIITAYIQKLIIKNINDKYKNFLYTNKLMMIIGWWFKIKLTKIYLCVTCLITNLESCDPVIT